MEKKLEPLKVETTEHGMIYITQGSYNGEENGVQIGPDQVDLLVTWLQEAKAELLAERAAAAR